MANKILSAEEAQKMRFRYVTGICENCGGNKFHFDPKEQTFVCEFCSTEVYKAEEEPEEVVEEIVEEEPVEETEVEETKTETGHSYSGGYTSYYSHGDSFLSALFLLVVGGAITLTPSLIRQWGLLENANLTAGGQAVEQMLRLLLTIFPILGCMIVILAVFKVATALLNPYR